MKGGYISIPLASGVEAGKRRTHYGIKLGVGLCLVAWLAWRGGWQEILSRLAGASPFWLALAVVSYLIGQSICSYKWSLLAAIQGFHRRRRFFWVNYLGAMFPSLFLPTSVGGDVFRAVALARGGGDKVGATVSVLAGRGTGVLAMVWIATLAYLAAPTMRLPAIAEDGLYALCAALTLGFAAPFLYRPRFARRGFLAKVMACWDQPGLLLTSLGLAFVFQALLGVIYIFLGEALGLRVHPVFYFFLCPVVSLAAMSPITINGLGVREAALVVLFPMVHVGGDRAVAFGLEWTGMVTLAALFGGAVLMLAAEAGGEPAGEKEGEEEPPQVVGLP